MHRTYAKPLLVALAGLTAGCAAPAPAPDLDAFRQELMDADRAFDEATAATGADGWVSYFSEDGAMIQEGVGEIRGHAAIRAAITPTLESGVSLRWEPVRADVGSGGDLGYTVGTWTVLAPGNETPAAQGMYVSIWKRQADGSWKVVMDLGNPTEGPAAG